MSLPFSFLSVGFAVLGLMASGRSSWSAEQATPAPLAPGWLHTADPVLVLSFRHRELPVTSFEGRRTAAELMESIVQELLGQGKKVYFSRTWVEEELEALRTFAPEGGPTNTANQTAQRLATILETSLRQRRLDWDQLRALHTAAPDSETVTRHLPWLSGAEAMRAVRLENESVASAAQLHYRLDWSTISTVGVVGIAGQRGLNSRVYSGKGELWRAQVDLNFVPATSSGSTNGVQRTYPAPAWKQRYSNADTRPSLEMTRVLLRDLRLGLQPQAINPEKGSRKKPSRP